MPTMRAIAHRCERGETAVRQTGSEAALRAPPARVHIADDGGAALALFAAIALLGALGTLGAVLAGMLGVVPACALDAVDGALLCIG
jgi:hypothetical protein